MDIKITQKNEQPLLARTEIIAQVSSEKTPSNDDFKKEIARSLKVDENLVAIRHIYQKFGAKESKTISYVYKDADAMKRIEIKPKAKKGASPEAAPEAKE